MLKDIDNLKRCLETIIKISKSPVSLKIRLGWDEDISLELLDSLKCTGIDAVKIHGRLATERYRGLANWEKIRKLKSRTLFPVIGNGDIKSYQ
ncbi:MAG TPA: tRNA dihydrouridine synthase DusB, partial [Anaerolineae bacterium]|nr:tRNA dihydrouridine synthase DusB [Anaerolineae bacterium]